MGSTTDALVGAPLQRPSTQSDARRYSTHRDAAALALLCLFTGTLALASLTERSVWVDEVFTKAVATAPGDRFFSDLSFNGANMSLYYGFMRFWLVVNESDWWLRLPSVAAAMASVPAFFVLACRIVSRQAALVGTALVAISPPLLLHAQEARSYSLTVLLVLLAWLAATAVVDQPSRRSRRLYVAAATAVVYSHLIGVFFIAAQLLWVGTVRRRDAAVSAAWVGVLVMPQLALALGPNAHRPDWVSPTTVGHISNTLEYVTGTGVEGVAFAIAGCWLVGMFVAKRRGDHIALIPVLWAVLPVAGIFVVSLVSPLLVGRYLVMAIPAWVLLLCVTWDSLPRLGPAMVAAALVVSSVGVHSVVNRTEPDWRTASEVLFADAERDEAVLFLRQSRPLIEHYWDEFGRPGGVPVPLSSPPSWGQIRRTYPPATSTDLLEGIDGAWVVDRRSVGGISEANRELLDQIRRRWPVTSHWTSEDGGITVVEYGGDQGL